MTTPPGTIHLVCGSTGAGKTTYAMALSRRLGAAHFSIDEWMVSLFGADKPPAPDWAWIKERVARCENLIAAMAVGMARDGVSSVLDISLLRAEDRQRHGAMARGAGVAARLHFVDVGAAERWRRVSGRNERKGATYRLTVTRFMFDFIETIWQPPDVEELAALDGVRVGGDGGLAA